MKKKDLNPEVKANIVSGMSSAVGSLAGVVAGSMATQNANAAETETSTEEVVEETTQAGQVTGTASEATENHVVVEVVDEPENDDDVNVISTEPDEVQIVQVDNPIEANDVEHAETRIETMTLDNGQQVDVTAIDVEGQMVGIADLGQDGVADIAFSDYNGDGEIGEEEVEDISEQGIEMQSLLNEANTDEGLTAQVTETDYVNDANVDMYYA